MEIIGGGNPQNNQNPNGANPLSNVNLKDAEYIKCENPDCDSEIFEEALKIKKISKFMTGSDRDTITPIPVLVCAKCKHVNELFKPAV